MQSRPASPFAPSQAPPAPDARAPFWWLAPALGGALWALILSCILAHRVFASNDSLSNYAHIWFIAQRLHEHGRIPFHMPVLVHGDGLTFPYGAPPWIVTALLWLLLGEWSVGVMLALGVLAATLAAVWWQPALRHPTLLGLFLLNGAFIETAVLAQFPFLWAVVFFFLGAAALRKGRERQAALWLALCQVTHPAVMLPPVALLALAYAWSPERRRRVLAAYGVALLAALPAVWLTLATPALAQNSRRAVLINYVGTMAPRMLILILPLLLTRYRAQLTRLPRRATAGMVVLLISGMLYHRDIWALKQLVRPASVTAVAAVQDGSFRPGAVYRVLDAADGKVSMYRALRAGAVLDSDFFPESLDRRSWSSPEAYRTFLAGREVEFVLITAAFDRDFHTNEHALLRALAERGQAQRVFADRHLEVYQIAPP